MPTQGCIKQTRRIRGIQPELRTEIIWNYLELFGTVGAPFHPGSRVLSQFRGTLKSELPLDLLAVILNGLHAQMQFLGDLPRLLPSPDQLEDLQLAVAQA